ncbi:hypothetical protein RclHR1_03400002 [Rhizophagus clarus]|uniref:SPRY domain-containing protein n=1 Tax=Rhizophagus clarus TaxID=94130 RepID=A0A2Z6RAH5_9GLOM|nr:hypothetical protein RclHR1_03400002 [Rhizophagus clarus]
MGFATPEYDVFRYSVILAAKQVSIEAYKTLIELLPTFKQIENPIKIENKLITDNQKVAKELEPLFNFIDFGRIKPRILADIIEPLEIVQVKIIFNVYRYVALPNDSNLSNTRGRSINESDYVWDDSACGSRLIIEDNGKIVQASSDCGHQNVRAKIALENEGNKGIFEWDVIIEKVCHYAWVGVCATENLDYDKFAGDQSTGWVLDSKGRCANSSKGIDYCPSFGDGTRITVHLDINKRTCAFAVNGILKYLRGIIYHQSFIQ